MKILWEEESFQFDFNRWQGGIWFSSDCWASDSRGWKEGRHELSDSIDSGSSCSLKDKTYVCPTDRHFIAAKYHKGCLINRALYRQGRHRRPAVISLYTVVFGLDYSCLCAVDASRDQSVQLFVWLRSTLAVISPWRLCGLDTSCDQSVQLFVWFRHWPWSVSTVVCVV